jgi:DNA repair protein RecO (recombination protein O)
VVVTTRAVVLQSRKQGETSKIVTLYTEQFGKLNVIAKGARELRSKFGGALEAFTFSDVVFYYKKDKGGLFLLSKAETVQSNSGILNSLDQIETASQIAEILIRTMHDEEENALLFALLADIFRAIASSTNEAARALLIYFDLRFANLSGYPLNLDETDFEGEGERAADTHFAFKVRTGEIIELQIGEDDDRHSLLDRNFIPIHAETYSSLRSLSVGSIENASAMRLSDVVFANLSDMFSAFFSEHFANMHNRALKSTGSLTRK